ncbi:MAG: lipase family protein [Bacteroidota bacterium]
MLLHHGAQAQELKPGFNVHEYLGVLHRSKAHYSGDSPNKDNAAFTRVYKSPVAGLSNKYDIWLDNARTTIAIDIRGTTASMDSWLENFYSAMIPATGSLTLSDSNTFHYRFARDPKALVHVGWAVGVGCMAPGIVQQIKTYYAQGIKQVIVEGHSQGGVLASLLSAYIHYLCEDGTLPADLVIKTYCSAAPKPGNLFFAYDYDYNNRGGWAFNVVNTADWVPETPVAVQTITDLNKLNPFTNAKQALRKQKTFVRIYTTHVYNRLNKGTRKAQKGFEKYTGKMMYKQVKKYLPGYKEPQYAPSANFTRAGTAIILQPGEEYYKKFPDTGSNVFRHHFFEPYYYLVQQVYK